MSHQSSEFSTTQLTIESTAAEGALSKVLANTNGDSGIVVTALLEFCRASRRAKLAEVAALERFERTLLTISGLH